MTPSYTFLEGHGPVNPLWCPPLSAVKNLWSKLSTAVLWVLRNEPNFNHNTGNSSELMSHKNTALIQALIIYTLPTVRHTHCTQFTWAPHSNKTHKHNVRKRKISFFNYYGNENAIKQTSIGREPQRQMFQVDAVRRVQRHTGLTHHF